MPDLLSSGVTVETDLAFGTGGADSLRCDVYRPPLTTSKASAVLLLRSRGVPRVPDDRDQVGLLLASAGLVCIVPEFRVGFRVSEKGFTPYPGEEWPAPVHDVKTAIRWTRANHDRLGIDAGAIFLFGGSNAGLMALAAAATAGISHLEGNGGNEGVSTSVAGVIAAYAPTVLSTWGIPLIVGKDAPQEIIDEVSPLRYCRPGFPPAMFLHGTDDSVIPPSNSVEMYDALRSHGVPAELHLFAGQSHSFIHQPEFLPVTAALISLFVSRHAGSRR